MSWVIFSHPMQQRTISWSDCDEWQKVDFIWQLATTSSVAGHRSSKAFPKAKLAKKGHGHCLVVCCQSDPLQLSYHSKTITPEKYAQQINEMHWKLQCLQLALVNSLLQGIFQTQGSNLCLLHGRQILYHWATWDMHFKSLFQFGLKWARWGVCTFSLPWSFTSSCLWLLRGYGEVKGRRKLKLPYVIDTVSGSWSKICLFVYFFEILVTCSENPSHTSDFHLLLLVFLRLWFILI